MNRLTLASRCMQAGIIGVAVAGIVTDHLTWVPAAVISLFVTFIPAILKRNLDFVLPVELNFWIVLALFLHVVGGFSNFYNDIPGMGPCHARDVCNTDRRSRLRPRRDH